MMMWDLDSLLGFFGGTLLGAFRIASLERGEHQQARRYARGMILLYLVGAFGAAKGFGLWQ